MIAKNNIFNIRYTTQTKWTGQIGQNKGFVEFDTREHAIRAWLVLMRTYRKKHGCDTIEKIITRFAPPIQNNTRAYINFCVGYTGLKRNDQIAYNMDYCRLGVAMAKIETNSVITGIEIWDVADTYNIKIVKQ